MLITNNSLAFRIVAHKMHILLLNKNGQLPRSPSHWARGSDD